MSRRKCERALKGDKLRRASRRQRGGDTARRRRTPKWIKALKASGQDGDVRPTNVKRASDRRRGDAAAAEGKALKSRDPMSACRTKQAGETWRGESRQEGEKP
jgi:hypothetical protein